MKILFIINPVSVRQRIDEVILEIKNLFPFNARTVITEYKGHATEMLLEDESNDFIFSVGGDGTFREIACSIGKKIEKKVFAHGNTLEKSGTIDKENPLVGVLPLGSGNDFARSISKTLDYKKILSSFLNRTIKRKKIDLGKVNDDEYFANIASIGFDSEIAHNAERYKNKKFLRKFSYIISIFYTLSHYKGTHLKVDIDGHKIEGNTLLLAVANGKYYGGGIKIAPQAEIDDGFFDVYYIPMLHPLKTLFLLPKLMNGSHTKLPFIKQIRARSVSAETDGKPFLLNLDGDLITQTKAIFNILPSCADILEAE